MRSRHVPLVAVLLAFVPARAGAEEVVGVARGRVELSTSASFSNQKGPEDGESWTVVNLPIRVGYFLTDRLSFEGELLATHVSSGGEDSFVGISLFFR